VDAAPQRPGVVGAPVQDGVGVRDAVLYDSTFSRTVWRLLHMVVLQVS
jgi:hypothetical protein